MVRQLSLLYKIVSRHRPRTSIAAGDDGLYINIIDFSISTTRREVEKDTSSGSRRGQLHVNETSLRAAHLHWWIEFHGRRILAFLHIEAEIRQVLSHVLPRSLVPSS